jgi:hypothetical protein
LGWIVAEDWRLADLLPGLYVAALIGGLAWVLARHFDLLPRRAWSLLSLFIALLFAPVLLGGRVLLPLENLRGSPPYAHLPPSSPGGHALQSDLVREVAPHLIQVRRAYAAGEWPLWNRLVGAGMPLLADPQTQSFQPLVLLAAPFPVHQAAGITAALRVAVAFLFLYLLLRRLGLGEEPALLGAAVYALGGAMLRWLGWPLANAVALLPAFLYAITRTMASGRRRDAILLCLVTFALLAAGQPEAILYALICGALFVALTRSRAAAEGRDRRALLRLAAAGAIGVALAAPLLLLAQEYLPQSERAAALQNAFGNRSLGEALASIARPEVLLEWHRRAVQRLVSLVAPRAWGDYDVYWGETNLIDDAAGFVGTGTWLLAIVALLAPASASSRGAFRWILGAVLALLFQPPGFEILTHRLPLIAFTAAHKHRRLMLVAALCVAYLAAEGLDLWRNTRRQRIVLWAAGLALAGLVVWGYLAHPNPNAGASAAAQRWRWVSLGAQLTALGATAAWLARSRAGPGKAGPLLAVACGELLFAHLPANVPNARHLAFPETPGITFLRQRLGEERMVGVGRTFPANFPSALGFADARIANASEPAAFARLTQPLRVPGGWGVYGAVDHELYDLLGVRFVAARPRARLPLPPVYRGADLAIYERPTALPLLFLAGTAGETPKPPPELVLSRLGNTRVSARVGLDREQLLTASMFQDGNWRLLVDGQLVEPASAVPEVFVAGRAPAGRHQIDLVYRPRRFAAGMLLAAAAILAGLVGWTPAPRRSSPASVVTR